MSFEYSVVSIWRANQNNAAQEKLSVDQAEIALIARPQMTVEIHTLSQAAFAALQALFAGRPLSDALHEGIEADENFDPQAFFQDLFTYNIIIGVNAEKAGQS